MSEPLWVRRKFFDSYADRSGEYLSELAPINPRFTCPCCGYPTLGGRGGFEICRLCWWEDDGQDDADADEVKGGPNQTYSLTDARLNFEQYLVMYLPESDHRLGGPDSKHAKTVKQKIIDAYDCMMTSPSSVELDALWAHIREGEDELEQELHRRTGIRRSDG